MKILGIDEAGRGCVLGALVVGAYLIEAGQEARLKALGVNDSKKLSKKKRETIRAQLGSVGTADERLISAHAIDGGNLNTLEETAIIDLVRTHRPDRVILDALGHPSTIPRTIERLREAVGGDIDWQMMPKADALFVVVGAASIVAKTTRDGRLLEQQESWGAFGSGYPSDPKTRAWLQALARDGVPWPPFVRTRWGTVRDIEAQQGNS